ncbi:helix-turn-helix transcriptional regulator [Micromonospora sp. NPDC050417]|uniref:helix-turn-helix transcriptional regulator n=1 Tax=Micromonospora sp. NPDC050417 TaxID=3364280 RepID=UPI00378C3196
MGVLMGMAELADRLGVSTTRVDQIVSRPDFPKPVDHIRAGRIWLTAEVEQWIREHRPGLVDDGQDDE